jgi:hypothetical protein
MPTSSIWGKSQTIEWFRKNEANIDRILDIGVGSGTYVKLIKEDAGICAQSHWVGVEIWQPYIEKYNLSSRYSSIINTDARKIDWRSAGRFDVALAGDVLEHMTKEEAIALVDDILAFCDTLIVSIPIVHYPQGAHEGNPHEEHVKDDWTHDEVVSTWGDLIVQDWHHQAGDVGVYWLTKTI